MKIPVFVSCPTCLNKQQEESHRIILELLNDLQLEPRALGRGDYPSQLPLQEVFTIARHCSGGLILGFKQFETNSGTWKQDTPDEKNQSEYIAFPTPWNHLEAGVLFGLKLPVLVFREPTVKGGVFDIGVTDVFVHPMPVAPLSKENKDAFKQVFLKWSAKVREHYYS
jgi:hypothetical protein